MCRCNVPVYCYIVLVPVIDIKMLVTNSHSVYTVPRLYCKRIIFGVYDIWRKLVFKL